MGTRARTTTTSMDQIGTGNSVSHLTSMQQDTGDSPRPLRDPYAPRPVGSSLTGFYGNGMPPGDALSEMAQSRSSEDDISEDEIAEEPGHSERLIEKWTIFAASIYDQWLRRRKFECVMNHHGVEVQMVLPSSSAAAILLP